MRCGACDRNRRQYFVGFSDRMERVVRRFCTADREYGNLVGDGCNFGSPALSGERVYDLSCDGSRVWTDLAVDFTVVWRSTIRMAEFDRDRSLFSVLDRDYFI